MTIAPTVRSNRGVDLNGAYIVRTVLRGANLERAVLTGADCTGTDFSFANLRGAVLSRARLVNASLHGADMEQALMDGADLRGANLSAVRNLTAEQVQSAIVDETTILPLLAG